MWIKPQSWEKLYDRLRDCAIELEEIASDIDTKRKKGIQTLYLPTSRATNDAVELLGDTMRSIDRHIKSIGYE